MLREGAGSEASWTPASGRWEGGDEDAHAPSRDYHRRAEVDASSSSPIRVRGGGGGGQGLLALISGIGDRGRRFGAPMAALARDSERRAFPGELPRCDEDVVTLLILFNSRSLFHLPSSNSLIWPYILCTATISHHLDFHRNLFVSANHPLVILRFLAVADVSAPSSAEGQAPLPLESALGRGPAPQHRSFKATSASQVQGGARDGGKADEGNGGGGSGGEGSGGSQRLRGDWVFRSGGQRTNDRPTAMDASVSQGEAAAEGRLFEAVDGGRKRMALGPGAASVAETEAAGAEWGVLVPADVPVPQPAFGDGSFLSQLPLPQGGQVEATQVRESSLLSHG